MILNWMGLRAQEVLNDYVQKNLEAKQHRTAEYNASIKIQVATRRFLVRKLINLWHKSAKEIQRFYRGHLGREYFHKCQRMRDYELRMAYFNYHATYIQRCFRGYWSRKYICDYYAKKAFISTCVLAGKQMKNLCTIHYKLEVRDEQEKAKKRVEVEIDKFLNDNHHKCSTKAVKGVYYSRHVAIFGSERSDLEEHIRKAHYKKVAGMGLENLKGMSEDGIPMKQGQNWFFIKSSKALHSRMSIDTRRRLKEASNKTKTAGTYITRQGHYESRYEHRKKHEKYYSLLNISDKRFDPISKPKKAWWMNMGPSIKNAEHYHLREMLAKAAAIKELEDYPVMKDSPWTSMVPSGFLFEMYKPFDKVFLRANNHHHWPRYSLS